MSYLSLFVTIVLVMSIGFYLLGYETPMNTYANITIGIGNASGSVTETDLTSGSLINPGSFLPGMIWDWIKSLSWLGIAGVVAVAAAVVFGALTNNPLVQTAMKIILLLIFFNVFANPIAPIFGAFAEIGPPWNWAFFIFMNYLMIMAYIEVAQGGSP